VMPGRARPRWSPALTPAPGVERRGIAARHVLVITGCALALHLLWLEFLAGSGGDLAAQDAWTGFALAHPGSAYDFAWYGGMHPASYSLISPYVMGVLGVRETMLVAGTLSAALVTLVLGHLPAVKNPVWASAYAALALTGNAVSGRATFGLGLAFGLGALAVVVAWPRHEQGRAELWLRGGLTCLLAGLATAASPVAGLFLGVVAAGLWLRRRRRAALAVGLLPVAVVLGTAVTFPFFGIQPFDWQLAILPLLMAGAGWALLPRAWRVARVCCVVYAAAVLVVWVVPTPIGTNITRLSLLFGGVALVAAASSAWWTSPAARRFGKPLGRVLLGATIVVATGWQVIVAGNDVAGSSSAATIDEDLQALVAQLDARGADLGRVEVVPTKSHREASALAPFVNLARGWNRQADVARNPIFYRDDQRLSARRYHRWLRSLSVRFVVLPSSQVDYAGLGEVGLIRQGVPYLHRVWSDRTWTLYEVTAPMPMASPPATLEAWDSAGLSVRMPTAGSTVLRIAWSPWLSVVDAAGRRLDRTALDGTCLAQLKPQRQHGTSRVVLWASHPGTYHIAAPYTLPRGSACPS
jgi:hypothetical protein